MGAGFDSGASGSVVLDHQYDDPSPASLVVVRAICALEDVDPTDAPDAMGFCLHDHVDPDALDRLVGGECGAKTVAISFPIDTYRVAIYNTGRLVIREVDTGAAEPDGR